MTAVPLGVGEGGRKRIDESRGGDTGKDWGEGGLREDESRVGK